MHRSNARFTEEPSSQFEENAPAGDAGVENEAEVSDDEIFSELPAPSPSRSEDVKRTRVLGSSRSQYERPAHLPEYQETIVVGQKREPAAPPPPPPSSTMDVSMGPGELEQTAVAQTPAPPPTPAMDKEIIAQAEAQAQQIIAQAQMQAQNMLNEIQSQAQEQAQMMAEQARQEAGQQGYQEGYQAGVEEGRRAGQIELQQLVHAVKFQFVEMVKLRRKILVDMEPEIVRLAWEVAKRVVGEELRTNREVIVGVVRSSLLTLQERDEILIRVNPSEYESVKAHQSEFEAMIEGLKKFVIQPDGAIEPGSCAIETNLGNVDARIDTQFEAIRLGLEEMTKIRQFEMSDQLAAQPVEVPGDPDFETRMREQGPPTQAHSGHQGHDSGGHEPEPTAQEEGEEQMMDFLPEPTPEILAQYSPEEQQQYIEIYNQQQAYLEQLQAQMAAEQEGQ